MSAAPEHPHRIPIWSANPTDRDVLRIIKAARDVCENSLEIINDGYVERIVALRAALVDGGYMPPLRDDDE